MFGVVAPCAFARARPCVSDALVLVSSCHCVVLRVFSSSAVASSDLRLTHETASWLTIKAFIFSKGHWWSNHISCSEVLGTNQYVPGNQDQVETHSWSNKVRFGRIHTVSTSSNHPHRGRTKLLKQFVSLAMIHGAGTRTTN